MSPHNLPANLQHGLLKTESPPTDKIQMWRNNKNYKSGITVHYKIMKVFFFFQFVSAPDSGSDQHFTKDASSPSWHMLLLLLIASHSRGQHSVQVHLFPSQPCHPLAGAPAPCSTPHYEAREAHEPQAAAYHTPDTAQPHSVTQDVPVVSFISPELHCRCLIPLLFPCSFLLNQYCP